MKSLLVTASLLNSWLWYISSDGEQKNRDEFTAVLKRERTPDNEAMQAGRAFETRVRVACDPSDISWMTDSDRVDLAKTQDDANDAEYCQCVIETANEVRGGAWQARLSRTEIIDGQPFVLYGRTDVIMMGVTDIKFTHTFEIGKYRDDPQTKMYLTLVPEAPWMRYLACDGRQVYEDIYRREDVDPIQNEVSRFWNWMKNNPEFFTLYVSNWESKY